MDSGPGLVAIGLGAEISGTGNRAYVASVSLGDCRTPCSVFNFLAPLSMNEVAMFRHIACGATTIALHPFAGGGHVLIFRQGGTQVLMVPIAVDDPLSIHMIATQVVSVFRKGRVVSYPLPANDPSRVTGHPDAARQAYLQ